MNDKIQKIGEILSGLHFSFSAGFSGRLMERITNMEQIHSPAYHLSERISRLFYYINVPGLTVSMVLLILLLLVDDFSIISFKSQYAGKFVEFLNNYYYHLIN
jgi:hypothetical protein